MWTPILVLREGAHTLPARRSPVLCRNTSAPSPPPALHPKLTLIQAHPNHGSCFLQRPGACPPAWMERGASRVAQGAGLCSRAGAARPGGSRVRTVEGAVQEGTYKLTRADTTCVSRLLCCTVSGANPGWSLSLLICDPAFAIAPQLEDQGRRVGETSCGLCVPCPWRSLTLCGWTTAHCRSPPALEPAVTPFNYFLTLWHGQTIAPDPDPAPAGQPLGAAAPRLPHAAAAAAPLHRARGPLPGVLQVRRCTT